MANFFYSAVSFFTNTKQIDKKGIYYPFEQDVALFSEIYKLQLQMTVSEMGWL